MNTTQDPLVGFLYRLMDKHLPVNTVFDEAFQAGFDVEQGTMHMRHDGLVKTAEEIAGQMRESAKKARPPKETRGHTSAPEDPIARVAYYYHRHTVSTSSDLKAARTLLTQKGWQDGNNLTVPEPVQARINDHPDELPEGGHRGHALSDTVVFHSVVYVWCADRGLLDEA